MFQMEFRRFADEEKIVQACDSVDVQFLFLLLLLSSFSFFYLY